MRTRSSLLVLALGATLLGTAPASANQPAVLEQRVYVESTVDSDRNGRPDRIAIDIARPSGSAKVPVIFEHSPYRSGLGKVPFHPVNVDRLPQEGLFPATRSDADPLVRKAVPDLPGWFDDYFVPRGYAVALGHSIGTGASEGCPTSGDQQEALSTRAVVDWLNGKARGFDAGGRAVSASWSTGAVGMTGVSYNGTLPNMVATTGVPGLRTIVPIAAQANWYEYYRANGLVVAPGGWQGEDADALAKAVLTRSGCADEIAELTRRQDRISGDFNAFWAERDYTRLAGHVKASVFVMHGQSDWNVRGRQYAQWWEALRAHGVPRKIWLHRGGHGPPSRTDYQATLLRWFEHWLKGKDTGIMREPMAEVQEAAGGWRKLADWPDPAARPVTYHLGADSPTAPGQLTTTPGGGPAQSFVDQGRTVTANTLIANPDSANGNRLVYRSAALSAPTRMSGIAKVGLRVAVENRDDANLTALVVDYGPPGSTPVIVTRGWIDPQNRSSQSASERVVRGQEYLLRFDLEPKDHVFAAGRRIGLVVIATDHDFTLRPLGGTRLRLAPAESTLTLPLVT
ncbi:Xaa-Pro dipeptidyl-peptidase [Crossiella sp. SN42]|uniref:Xaa-Pro dipeptidyl-peptidase n=1 Tax=Crossiella sp. SN42 TaxID=2944808 RepID=UPI00207CB03B|nr:Xaa-Pro dipeptidyl-peptidase [Crossiella sp. SN42]MCO1574343.1 Xaa-Pro dipeptidyl-peptidase [Crossiella sp. SN42]